MAMIKPNKYKGYAMTIYIIAGESINQIEWDDRCEPEYDIWFSSLEDANDYLEHLLLD